jgi:hypothetical protein
MLAFKKAAIEGHAVYHSGGKSSAFGHKVKLTICAYWTRLQTLVNCRCRKFLWNSEVWTPHPYRLWKRISQPAWTKRQYSVNDGNILTWLTLLYWLRNCKLPCQRWSLEYGSSKVKCNRTSTYKPVVKTNINEPTRCTKKIFMPSCFS